MAAARGQGTIADVHAPIRARVDAVVTSLLSGDDAVAAREAALARCGRGPAIESAMSAAVEELRGRMRVTDEVLVTVLADEGGVTPATVATVMGLASERVDEVLADYRRAVDELRGQAPTPATDTTVAGHDPVTADDGADGQPDEPGDGVTQRQPQEPPRRLVFIDDALSATESMDDSVFDRPAPRRYAALAWALTLALVVATVLLLAATAGDDPDPPSPTPPTSVVP